MIGKDVTGARAEGPASRTAVRWDCGRSQVPKKSRAARTSSASLARCASAVMALPATEVAKPHCGLSASRSASTTQRASPSRALICSSDSTRDVFVVTRPSTTTFPPGTSRSGTKVPDRSSSYSSTSRSACTPPNTGAAIASYPPATSQRLSWLPRHRWKPNVAGLKPGDARVPDRQRMPDSLPCPTAPGRCEKRHPASARADPWCLVQLLKLLHKEDLLHPS